MTITNQLPFAAHALQLRAGIAMTVTKTFAWNTITHTR